MQEAPLPPAESARTWISKHARSCPWSLSRFDRIETGLHLTGFLDAHRFFTPDQVRGRLSLADAPVHGKQRIPRAWYAALLRLLSSRRPRSSRTTILPG